MITEGFMRYLILFSLLLPIAAAAKVDLLDMDLTPEQLFEFVANEPVCLLDGYAYWQGDYAFAATGEYWLCEVTETGFNWLIVTQSN